MFHEGEAREGDDRPFGGTSVSLHESLEGETRTTLVRCMRGDPGDIEVVPLIHTVRNLF